MKKKLLYIILVLLIAPATFMKVFSQDATLISPYIQISYLKNTDNLRILQTSLTYSMNRMELPLPGMEVAFYTGKDNKELLASVLTDNKGVARFELPADFKAVTGSDGLWAFSSEFKGNDTIEAGISEIEIKDVRLELVLSLVDTIKTVTVNAFINENGNDKPVAGEAVKIYVPRMFSNLLISELTLDDAGTAYVEFPDDLPGDTTGHLTVIAKFEENMTFGNVEKREVIDWGTKTDYSIPTTHRALWTKTAPKWMIYTLSILLAGVWGHYLFAILSLVRIKRDADRRKAKEGYKS